MFAVYLSFEVFFSFSDSALIRFKSWLQGLACAEEKNICLFVIIGLYLTHLNGQWIYGLGYFSFRTKIRENSA